MSLFEKRVEAAAEVLLRDYQSEYDGGEVSEFLDVARAVLEAADAVVTVEELSYVILRAPHAVDAAEAVLSLFRGGAK